jgi:hypothetical protein
MPQRPRLHLSHLGLTWSIPQTLRTHVRPTFCILLPSQNLLGHVTATSRMPQAHFIDLKSTSSTFNTPYLRLSKNQHDTSRLHWSTLFQRGASGHSNNLMTNLAPRDHSYHLRLTRRQEATRTPRSHRDYIGAIPI